METLKQCFGQHKRMLTSALVDAQFSAEQAERFLPAAALEILLNSSKTSVFQTMNCLMKTKSNRLLRKFDVASVADRSGISLIQVAIGLKAIAPVLLQACLEGNVNAAQTAC